MMAFGILTLAALSTPALATCYSSTQARAEQLLRLHSELMVVAVTCRQGSDGRDLSKEYVSFTRKNIRALHNAEQTLMKYYKESGQDNPTESLDHLRTRLGNEAGQAVAKMTAPVFCARYRDDIARFRSESPEEIDKQTQHMAKSTKAFEKTCGIISKDGEER